jgi:hypothetical protein
MNAADCAIRVSFRWQPEEADGTTCIACGDIAWISHRRIMLFIGDDPRGEPQDLVLCNSCFKESTL